MDNLLWYLIPAVALGIVGLIVQAFRNVVVVYEEQFALHWRNGKFVGRLPSGRSVLWGARHRVLTIDRRTRHDAVAGQEILSADGAMVRVSLLVAYRVTDPELHFHASATPEAPASSNGFVHFPFWPQRSLAHEAAHAALRDAIAKRTMEACLGQRAEITEEIASAVAPDFAAGGLALDRIVVKDLGVGGDLKRAMGDLQVAQFQARANLERARAEGAVLRSLANTARTLESNPALVQMKLLQAIESGRAQVVIGADALRVAERPGVRPPADLEE
ncbi:MAG: hypothetical protein KIS66_02360 [Fimbriimonadaceae bacterium]|nr:hypothetical protein [Fimbriimonadaceae bacterium]